jgi:hypothetical protein
MPGHSLCRQEYDQISSELRAKGYSGWLIVRSDGTYTLDNLYPLQRDAEVALHSKDPTSPLLGGTIIYINRLEVYVVLCPNCRSIRKAGTVCPICKCPVPDPRVPKE